MVCNFKTKGVCATNIKFELDGNVVRAIEFTNGCDGNLKAISRILDGTTVEFIQENAAETCAAPRELPALTSLQLQFKKRLTKQIKNNNKLSFLC